MKAFFYESNFLLSVFVYCNVYDYDAERGDFFSLRSLCRLQRDSHVDFICRRVEKAAVLLGAI